MSEQNGLLKNRTKWAKMLIYEKKERESAMDLIKCPECSNEIKMNKKMV